MFQLFRDTKSGNIKVKLESGKVIHLTKLKKSDLVQCIYQLAKTPLDPPRYSDIDIYDTHKDSKEV